MTAPVLAPTAISDLDFEAVYSAHVAAVYRFCLTQLRDPTLAEDAASDVFTAALRAWGRVEHADRVKLWLFGIARNVVADHYRALRRRQRLQQFVRSRDQRLVSRDPQETAAVRDDLRRIGVLVAKLRRRERVLLGLRVSGDLSHGEIAALMNMSEQAVRVAIHRALSKIRAQWESEDE